MRLRTYIFLLLPCFFVPASLAQKQDDKALELLEKARSMSLNNASSLPPYRIQASFETFDEKGQSDGKGTVVQTGLADGKIKRVVTFRDKTFETVKLDGWHSVADADYLETFLERHLLDALLAPVPPAADYKDRTITLRPFKAGTALLQCAIISVPVPDENNSHAAAPSNAYCMDSVAGMLRMIAGHNDYNIVLNGFRKLQNVDVPGDVSIAMNGVKRGQLHLDRFVMDNSLTPADFTAPEVKPGMVDPTRSAVSHDIVAHAIVKKTPPKYPDSARQNHISGTVVLNAIIGRDGKIRDLELLTAPDGSLATASMEAVKTWQYKPYFVDGKPTEVETTITVNFAFNRR